MQPPLLKACTSKIQLQHRVCNAPITSGPKGWKSKSFLSRHCQELFLYGSNLGPEPAGRCLHYFLSQWKTHQHPQDHAVCGAWEQLTGAALWHLSFPHSEGSQQPWRISWDRIHTEIPNLKQFQQKKNLPFASKVQLVGTGEDLMVSRGDSQLRALS